MQETILESKSKIENGIGTLIWSDESKYVGEIIDDQPNGRGTLTYPGGGKYEGNFKDGNFNGQGVYTLSDGQEYDGEFKDGRPNGIGKWTYCDGSFYEGDFKDGHPNGIGILKEASKIERAAWESFYHGEWKTGKKHGEGYCSYYCPPDDLPINIKDNHPVVEYAYSGKWESNSWNGEGQIKYFEGSELNGHQFVGEFRYHNVFNGTGVIEEIFIKNSQQEHGVVFKGEIRNGVKWEGRTFDRSGKLCEEVFNGKIINPQT